MDVLAGETLITPQFETVKAGPLIKSSHLVLYFFSAMWCHHSRSVICELYRLQNLCEKAKIPAIFILVSMEDTKEDWTTNLLRLTKGWYSVPYGANLVLELKYRYQITAIPKLIVVRRSGEIVTREGIKELKDLGVDALVSWL